MNDTLRKVSQGDRWAEHMRPGVWNAFVDAAMAHQSKGRGARAGDEFSHREPDIITIKNAEESQAFSWFHVVAFGASLIDPANAESTFLNTTVVEATIPVAADLYRWGVTLDPAAVGKCARCVCSGVVPVKIDIVNKNHLFADIYAGEWTKLKSYNYGAAKILWKELEGEETETGDQWAIVRLGHSSTTPIVRFRLEESLVAGGDADATVIYNPGGGGEEDGETITVYDSMNSFAGITNALGKAHWASDARRWEVLQLECG